MRSMPMILAPVRDDGVPQTGRMNDVHPENPDLPASHDRFFCTTGAQESDPSETACYVDHNPDIYPTKAQSCYSD